MPENIAWSFLDLLWHVQQPVFCSSKLVKLFGGQLRSLSTTSGWVCCQRPKYVSLSSFLMSRLHNHYVITGRLLQFNDGIIKESCLLHVFLNVTITPCPRQSSISSHLYSSHSVLRYPNTRRKESMFAPAVLHSPWSQALRGCFLITLILAALISMLYSFSALSTWLTGSRSFSGDAANKTKIAGKLPNNPGSSGKSL